MCLPYPDKSFYCETHTQVNWIWYWRARWYHAINPSHWLQMKRNMLYDISTKSYWVLWEVRLYIRDRSFKGWLKHQCNNTSVALLTVLNMTSWRYRITYCVSSVSSVKGWLHNITSPSSIKFNSLACEFHNKNFCQGNLILEKNTRFENLSAIIIKISTKRYYDISNVLKLVLSNI